MFRRALAYCTCIQYLATMAGRRTPLPDIQMNAADWTFRFASQLHQQWPRVDRCDLENLAEALLREERWRAMEPSEAAVRWLQQAFRVRVI